MNQINLFYSKKCMPVLAGSQKIKLSKLQGCFVAATRLQTTMKFWYF